MFLGHLDLSWMFVDGLGASRNLCRCILLILPFVVHAKLARKFFLANHYKSNGNGSGIYGNMPQKCMVNRWNMTNSWRIGFSPHEAQSLAPSLQEAGKVGHLAGPTSSRFLHRFHPVDLVDVSWSLTKVSMDHHSRHLHVVLYLYTPLRLHTEHACRDQVRRTERDGGMYDHLCMDNYG